MRDPVVLTEQERNAMIDLIAVSTFHFNPVVQSLFKRLKGAPAHSDPEREPLPEE